MDDFRVFTAADRYRWPSGRPRSVAALRLTPEELSRRVGAPLEAGVEAGLGPWRGCGLRLPSGRRVELVRYDGGPEPEQFDLRADAADDPAAARREALAALGLSAADVVVWAPPDA